VIIDASVIIAIAQRQSKLQWALDALGKASQAFLRMSRVNIAKSKMSLQRDNPGAQDAIDPILAELGIIPLEIDRNIVHLAVVARGRFPLNFGNCFA